MTTKRVMRFDSELREDESMFREDRVNEVKLLFEKGARVGAFLHDSAHVTAAGVFPYADGNGGIRMEYRPAEEVSNTVFLDSLQGIPLTMLHPKNTREAPSSIIGMVKSKGVTEDTQDPKHPVEVRSEIVAYEADAVTKTKVRGLSLGFTCDLDETPGLTPWGEKYDAIQRNLRADHLAVVPNPRVKTARLNLDHNDTGKPKMPQVRLDNGIEYEAAQEVIHELNTVKARADSSAAQATNEKARADKTQAELDSLKANITKIKEDAEAEAFERAKQRIALETVAKDFGVQVKADSTDISIMSEVIKAVRGDAMDLTGKNEDYLRAAFDFAIADAGKQPKKGATSPAHKTMLHGDDEGTKGKEERNDSKDEKSAASAREKMLKGIGA